jgi:hypothetical protein
MNPDRSHDPLPVLLVCMTVVTGLVDAFSYLSLGHVFVANMTGNVVSSASRWRAWLLTPRSNPSAHATVSSS